MWALWGAPAHHLWRLVCTVKAVHLEYWDLNWPDGENAGGVPRDLWAGFLVEFVNQSVGSVASVWDPQCGYGEPLCLFPAPSAC